ncbi:alpha amylase domain-containing protein [sediment metagenome]|uniref:Alpha amylase domain-containing protein n=1 Tax=sediment metagenome TaxID=749907 RepID=D9PGC0_9ZZZZ
MNKLSVYTAFHLNLCYSSIEEELRPEIIRKCYHPLLALAGEHGIPIGIEAPAWTLARIFENDPEWIAKMRKLCNEGLVELIGSGWSQLIGPLVPYQVVEANLRIGMDGYERMLGQRPNLWLMNEQAYSAGLVPLYREAGCKALLMEWENPAVAHPEWPKAWKYFPQTACGLKAELPILWVHGVAFQKMQRYAHGEITCDELVAWTTSQTGEEGRSLCIYGSDTEVFGFRPGRYGTEAAIREGEWNAIAVALKALSTADCNLSLPSKIVSTAKPPLAFNRICLESPEHPVPTKKQPKYNPSRWACGGYDAPGINAGCYRILSGMLSGKPNESDWETLCELWASDYRTHLTLKRWEKYKALLSKTEKQWRIPAIKKNNSPTQTTSMKAEQQGRYLILNTANTSLRLNLRRGMSIDRLSFDGFGDTWLCGGLPHGFLDDPSWSADWYTWPLVLERPGAPKVTDLEPAEPQIKENECGLAITSQVQTALGPVIKTIILHAEQPKIEIIYRICWKEIPPGSLRLGDVILNPAAFSRDQLKIRTHLGGRDAETFQLGKVEVDHGHAVSFLVSARQVLGCTNGWIEIGDDKHMLHIEVDHKVTACPALLTIVDIANSWFGRIAFSGREMDDTCSGKAIPIGPDGRAFRFAISPVC